MPEKRRAHGNCEIRHTAQGAHLEGQAQRLVRGPLWGVDEVQGLQQRGALVPGQVGGALNHVVALEARNGHKVDLHSTRHISESCFAMGMANLWKHTINQQASEHYSYAICQYEVTEVIVKAAAKKPPEDGRSEVEEGTHLCRVVADLLDVVSDLLDNFVVPLLVVLRLGGVHLVEGDNHLLDAQGVS